MNHLPSDTPKLYTSSEVIAAELRELYPDIEVIITPKEYLPS